MLGAINFLFAWQTLQDLAQRRGRLGERSPKLVGSHQPLVCPAKTPVRTKQKIWQTSSSAWRTQDHAFPFASERSKNLQIGLEIHRDPMASQKPGMRNPFSKLLNRFPSFPNGSPSLSTRGQSSCVPPLRQSRERRVIRLAYTLAIGGILGCPALEKGRVLTRIKRVVLPAHHNQIFLLDKIESPRTAPQI